MLVVDVYHELAYPFEVMTKVCESLKPGGRVVFVEYRKEDPAVRIKEVHKMSVKQLEREMSAVGLVRVRTVETLPCSISLFSRSAIRLLIVPDVAASDRRCVPIAGLDCRRVEFRELESSVAVRFLQA